MQQKEFPRIIPWKFSILIKEMGNTMSYEIIYLTY